MTRGGRAASLSLVLALVLALVLGACAVPDQRSPVDIQGLGLQTTPSTTVEGNVSVPGFPVTVYFVGSNNLLVGETRSDPSGRVSDAIADLLAGPSRTEVAAGTSSAVPSGTKLLSTRVSQGIAYLNFSAELTAVSGHEEMLAFAQIVTTATSAPNVSAVQISVKGQQVNAPKPDSTLAQRPVTAEDYRSLLAG